MEEELAECDLVHVKIGFDEKCYVGLASDRNNGTRNEVCEKAEVEEDLPAVDILQPIIATVVRVGVCNHKVDHLIGEVNLAYTEELD